MNVLIIDDDPAVRNTFSRVLEQADFDVTAVGGGFAALKELRNRPFQAVVCDVILPVTDGTSVYEELRDEFPEMANRVLFVTGWPDDDKVTRLLKHTGQPYLKKPVELHDLVAAVRQVAESADVDLPLASAGS